MMMTNLIQMMDLQKNEDQIKREKKRIIVFQKTSEIAMNEEYDYHFMRNQNYYYLVVSKPNVLLANFL